MKYITEIKAYKHKKKVVGARVPENILESINSAKHYQKGNPGGLNGYDFSVSKIIEGALLDALDEIEMVTGINFYEIEKFKYNIREWYEEINPKIDLDIEDYIENTIDDIYEKHYMSGGGNYKEVSMMSPLLEDKMKNIKTEWISEAWKSYGKKKPNNST